MKPLTYVAVDLDAIRHNVQQVLNHVAEGSLLCAVVKANAYGHGMIPVAQTCIETGARWLAVSTVEEGVALREAGIGSPILVFMPPLTEECEAAVAHDLTATVTSTAHVMDLQREAQRQGRIARAHAYEDLGLGRMGIQEGLMDLVELAEAWPQIELGGVYAHFGPPGSGMHVNLLNIVDRGGGLRVYAAMLAESVQQITERRLMFHAAASAMFLAEPAHHFDMVRIGTLLYGQYPDHVPAANRGLQLRDTFELRSHIVSTHTLEKGSKVGYGGDFTCARQTRVATVPVGFSHGLGVVPESAANHLRFCARAFLRLRDGRKGRERYLPVAQVAGKRAPLIGRISMDQCCLDVTDIPEAIPGTEVILPARRVSTLPTLPRVYEPFTQP